MKIRSLLGLWLWPDRILRSYLERTAAGYPVDRWQRYTCVTRQIRACAVPNETTVLLDVGGGEGIIDIFLPRDKFCVQLADINEKAVIKARHNRRLKAVVADGCRLPFGANTFDIVVSVASLEHVPDSVKEDYCNELKRVTRRAVVLYCPVDSSDGTFQGSRYDRMYYEWYRRVTGREEFNTLEHMEAGLPTVQDLLDLFPGARVEGTQKAAIWLKIMQAKELPYLGLLTTPWYNLFLKRKDREPPFYACTLVWKKTGFHAFEG